MSCKKIFALTLFLIASMSVSGFAQENSNKIQADEIKNVATNEVIFETPKGYDDNDYQKLVTFLESPSKTGSKNGYYLNYKYDPINPDTWTGIKWIESTKIKKVNEIYIYGYNNIKENISGYLDVSNFSNLQYLGCSYTDISNLDLSDLYNLQYLNCSNTEISSLDLSTLFNLQELHCNNTGISSLDLSNLSNLQELYCNFTRISSLDLSGLSNLQELYCNYTGISSLDLSGLSNLERLECSATNISSLNLLELPNLLYLDCSNTDISSLNLSELHNLQYLGCSYTGISNLDLSGLSNLQILGCAATGINSLDLSGLSNLQRLSCSGTGISSLDLSKLHNLQALFFDNTNISSLDLSGLSNLQELRCYNTRISSLDLSGLSNLQILECAATGISSLDLSELHNLQSLLCYNTNINSLDLSELHNLQSLFCYNTNISGLNLIGLPYLKYLDCYNCKLGIDELRKLKVNYNSLFDNKFLNQNILDSYLYKKGDIKRFGNENSIYRWYIDGELIDLSTSAYDFSEYIGRKVKCEIIDRDMVLTSGEATIVDIDAEVKFDNPPKNIAKGSSTKLVASVEAKDTDMDIDKSVSWSVYNSTASTISVDGVLNVPFNETSETITVRATSNFDSTKYAEIELKVLSPTEIDLQTDKASYIYGDIITLNAFIQEIKSRTIGSNEISFYNRDTLLGTREVVDNQASIQIDTKDLGIGTFNFRADFSGYDKLLNSTANIDVTVNKISLDSPTNLKWIGKVASWNRVDNCSQYQIQLFKDSVEIETIYSDKLEYDFNKNIVVSGDYSFSVKALGNDKYNDSEVSTSDIYTHSNTHYDNLLNAIAEGKEICNKDDATTGELIKAIVKISRSLKEFEENK